MVELLMLKDTVDNVIKSQDVLLVDGTVNIDAHVYVEPYDTLTNDKPTDPTNAEICSPRPTQCSDTNTTANGMLKYLRTSVMLWLFQLGRQQIVNYRKCC